MPGEAEAWDFGASGPAFYSGLMLREPAPPRMESHLTGELRALVGARTFRRFQRCGTFGHSRAATGADRPCVTPSCARSVSAFARIAAPTLQPLG